MVLCQTLRLCDTGGESHPKCQGCTSSSWDCDCHKCKAVSCNLRRLAPLAPEPHGHPSYAAGHDRYDYGNNKEILIKKSPRHSHCYEPRTPPHADEAEADDCRHRTDKDPYGHPGIYESFSRDPADKRRRSKRENQIEEKSNCELFKRECNSTHRGRPLSSSLSASSCLWPGHPAKEARFWRKTGPEGGQERREQAQT